MRAKRDPQAPEGRALVREVEARARLSIDGGGSPRELSRALTVRFDESQLTTPAFRDCLARAGRGQARLAELIQSGIQALLAGMADRILVGPVLRRLQRVRERIRTVLASRRRSSEERAALGSYLELAAVTGAASGDPSRVPALLALLRARPGLGGDPSVALTTEIATLLLTAPGDRALLAPARVEGSWAWLLRWWPWTRWRGRRWRRQRILEAFARCDLRPGQRAHNASRFFDANDHLTVAAELTGLFMDLVPQPGDEDPRPLPSAGDELCFALLLDRFSVDDPDLGLSRLVVPPPDGEPNIGGFNPGSGAPPPPAELALAAWYWQRAPVLTSLPDLKIRKLDKIERDVVGTERVETREMISLGVELDRPLRYQEFRPDIDDPFEIHFSHIMLAMGRPIVDRFTFGVARARPAVAVPREVLRTSARDVKRKETALVEIEFDVARLAAGASLFDQILFIRDSSGSMGGFMPGTPLDCVTLGIFSVLKTLHERRLTRRFRYGAIDFANSTQFSGYVGWDDRHAFDRVVLTQQNGGTTVDASVVRRALEGPDRTLVLFMSDGELAVIDGTPQELVSLLRRHEACVVASAPAISSFCKLCADAPVTTILLDRIDQVATVFSAIATGGGDV